jgi:hypothetical protein
MKITHWGFGSVGAAVLVLVWGCSSQPDGSQVAPRTTESASFDFGAAVVDVNRTDTGVVASVVDRAGTLLLRTEVTPTAWTTDVPGANVHRVSGAIDGEHAGLKSWAEYAYNAWTLEDPSGITDRLNPGEVAPADPGHEAMPMIGIPYCPTGTCHPPISCGSTFPGCCHCRPVP